MELMLRISISVKSRIKYVNIILVQSVLFEKSLLWLMRFTWESRHCPSWAHVRCDVANHIAFLHILDRHSWIVLHWPKTANICACLLLPSPPTTPITCDIVIPFSFTKDSMSVIGKLPIHWYSSKNSQVELELENLLLADIHLGTCTPDSLRAQP